MLKNFETKGDHGIPGIIAIAESIVKDGLTTFGELIRKIQDCMPKIGMDPSGVREIVTALIIARLRSRYHAVLDGLKPQPVCRGK